MYYLVILEEQSCPSMMNFTNLNKKLTGEADGIIAFWDFESEEELLDQGPNAYESEYGGDAIIEVGDIPKMSENFVQTNFQNTNSYILKNVKAGQNYRVFSFIDVNGNNVADLNEPFGEFGELIDISKDMININIKNNVSLKSMKNIQTGARIQFQQQKNDTLTKIKSKRKLTKLFTIGVMRVYVLKKQDGVDTI